MIDVSFFLPGIRTHMWEDFYKSAKLACQEHSFEIVVVSPFDPPEILQNNEQFRVIKDMGHPTRCAQIAALNSRGRLIYHCVDDGIFVPESVDYAIAIYDKSCTSKDMINMRYREGPNYSGGSLPLAFWDAKSSQELCAPGIDSTWRTAPHFLVDRKHFLSMGGFDCQFEYLNHPLHDLAFRVQANGGRIYHSPTDVINCTHYPELTVDHAPVHNAQINHDLPIFRKIYQNPRAAYERMILDISNWKNAPTVWKRRFGDDKITSYVDLISKSTKRKLIMTKPEISLILPSIRTKELVPVYDSICKATSRPFEVIVISPYALPDELLQHKNVKYVRDFGSPVRAHNIGLLLCEGNVIAWAADDALMIENSLDQHIDMLYAMGDDKRNVVVGKYREGAMGSEDQKKVHGDDYFKIRTTPAASPYFPQEWWLFNVAFMYREFAEALGGWDCKFEATWPAHTDMAIRAQAAGSVVKMSGIERDVADHMPGTTGDHAPIHHAQGDHDVPLLHTKYRKPEWWKTEPAAVNIMNWKNAESIWQRRFGNE
jgi:hypothetical protein